MMKKIIFTFFIFILYTTNLLSKDMNILDFDIAGIKLRMTPEKVMEKLKSTYNLKDEEISFDMNRDYHKGVDLSAISTLKTKRSRDRKFDVYISFCTSEDEKGATEASIVEYSIPDATENRKKMYDMAIEKYGKPSFSSYSKTTHTWCNGNKFEKIIGHTYKCIQGDIHLTLRNTSLSLYSKECMLNNIRIRENKKITSPKF